MPSTAAERKRQPLARPHDAIALLEWDAYSAAPVDGGRRALALEPTNPEAHHWYADLLYALAVLATAQRLGAVGDDPQALALRAAALARAGRAADARFTALMQRMRVHICPPA